ncbi:MAG: CHAT domain-containing protein, partial [Saprospiraceae bacterium]|nr:CHAT domain-containing protein [Saprospiraceae bacterium]
AESYALSRSDQKLGHNGFIYQEIGQYYMNRQELDKALDQVEKALKFYYQANDSFRLSKAHLDLGEIYLLQDRNEDALSSADQSLAFAGYVDSEFLRSETLENKNVDDFFDPLEFKGRLLYKYFQKNRNINLLRQALEAYQDIDHIAEYYRSGTYSEGTEVIIGEHFHRAAKGALRCLVELERHDPDPANVEIAFRFMEHNRYAQLLENASIAQGNSVIVHDSNRVKRNALLSELEKWQQLANQGETKQNVYEELLRAQRRLNDLIDETAKISPGYFQLRYESVLTIKDIQEKLETDQQIIEYLWGDSTITILNIRSDTSFFLSTQAAPVELRLNRLLPWLVTTHRPDSIELSFAEFSDLAHELYRYLLEPVLTEKCNRLILCPDGKLTLLPMDILLTDTEGTSYKTASYLLHDYEISYALSANLQFKRPQTKPVKKPTVLAMAYSHGWESDLVSEGDFLHLPGSSLEVDAIKKRIRGKIIALKGRAASESAFRQNIQDADIVHLAVHGIGDRESSLDSRLIFRTEDDSLDGRLYARELYNLDQPPKLVVLSACETGIGKDYPGEGVFSIARGFAFAQTPAIALSLWEVDDEATAIIMDHFYRYLAKGNSISKSLQIAKIDYLQTALSHNSQPFYWATMVPMGSPISMVPKSRASLIIFLLSILILLIAVFIIIRSWTFPRSSIPSSN